MAVPPVSVALPAASAMIGVALILLGGDFAQGAGIVLLGVALLLAVLNLYTHRGMERERRDRQGTAE